MKDKVKCPCCQNNRDAIKDSPLLAIEFELHQRNANPWWGNFKGWSIKKAKLGQLQWACNFCLKRGNAIAAQPWVQTFCDCPPYCAYFNVSLHCEDCQAPFVFSAQEQQYWYEVLKFWVQSRPKQCIDCRRACRERQKTQAEAKSAIANRKALS